MRLGEYHNQKLFGNLKSGINPVGVFNKKMYFAMPYTHAIYPPILFWEDAAAYCRSLNLYGYCDWYLPSIDELKFICDKESFGSIAAYAHLFFYWSSTEVNNDCAYVYMHGDVSENIRNKSNTYMVLPVRCMLCN